MWWPSGDQTLVVDLGQEPGGPGRGRGARLEEHQAGHPDRAWPQARLCSQLVVGTAGKEGAPGSPVRGTGMNGETGRAWRLQMDPGVPGGEGHMGRCCGRTCCLVTPRMTPAWKNHLRLLSKCDLNHMCSFNRQS